MSLTHVPAQLRRVVRNRANNCCEYCRVPEESCFESHQIDHIISEKHGGRTAEDNLALSCTICNRRKGADLAAIDPQTGQVTPLFHPRKDKWVDHFQFQGPRIISLTSIGRTTIEFLKLNAPTRLQERAAFWP